MEYWNVPFIMLSLVLLLLQPRNLIFHTSISTYSIQIHTCSSNIALMMELISYTALQNIRKTVNRHLGNLMVRNSKIMFPV